MSLRQLPGALILGLLASLIAHAAGFGSTHLEAGPFHDSIVTLALAGVGGGLIAALWAAFSRGGRCAQGTVLAARLCTWIPRARGIALCAAGWFSFMELLEPAHAAASVFLVVTAMLAAAVILRMAAMLCARLLARCALAIAVALAAPRTVYAIRPYRAPAIVSPHLVRRIVTRPPPRRVLIPA